jgi:hypothetical protein
MFQIRPKCLEQPLPAYHWRRLRAFYCPVKTGKEAWNKSV